MTSELDLDAFLGGPGSGFGDAWLGLDRGSPYWGMDVGIYST